MKKTRQLILAQLSGVIGLIALVAGQPAYAESIYDKAARISCDMVKDQKIHWAEKASLRRVYFVAIYDEFENNKYSSAEDLKWSLRECE